MSIHTLSDLRGGRGRGRGRGRGQANANNNNNKKLGQEQKKCLRCGRGTHLASTCKNKTDADGNAIREELRTCKDCGEDISEKPKYHKQCIDCYKGIVKPIWERKGQAEANSVKLVDEDELEKMREEDEEEEREEEDDGERALDMFGWGNEDGIVVAKKKKKRKNDGDDDDDDEVVVAEKPSIFAGRLVEKTQIEKSYEKTQLEIEEESRKRKAMPIVIDLEEEEREEMRKAVQRRREAYERSLKENVKRNLGIKEKPKIIGDSSTNNDGKDENTTTNKTNDNPFWKPESYIPTQTVYEEDYHISTDGFGVECRDVGLQWVGPYKACLDTGNGGCTLIQQHVAQALGLCDALGRPTESNRQKIRVQGVVAGAAEMIYQCTLTYRIKGKEMTCKAGITKGMGGLPLLISRREIQEFERCGYKFKA